jgi:hypothetical protein
MSNGITKLRKVLVEEIERFNTHSEKHKKRHRHLQLAVVVLTAVTTVVAGAGLIAPQGSNNYVQFVVLMLAAATTAVSSWNGGQRTKDIWQHEREIYWSLKDLQREIDFRSSYKELGDADAEDYFRRAAGILGSSFSKWGGILGKQKD